MGVARASSSSTPWRSTGSADVVGLLADKTVYAVYGDHGGAQKDVQRIPMAFYVKGIKHKDATAKAKLVDIMPTILQGHGHPSAGLRWTARRATSGSDPGDARSLKRCDGRGGRKGRPARPAYRCSGGRVRPPHGGRRRQAAPRPPAPAPAVRPSDESSFWMLSLMASAVSCTAAFSG